MKRPSPRFEVLGLAAALALSGSCTPNTSVKPGAPVLTEMVVVENGTPYPITPVTPVCTADIREGSACDATKETICQQVAANDAGMTSPNWCRCRGVQQCPEFDGLIGLPPPPTMSTWNCGGFAPTTSFIAVFDRLLDTTPFAADGGPLTNVATVAAPPASMSTIDAVYTPNGSPERDDAGNFKAILFPLYECVNALFGGTVFNDNGPNLGMVPDPQFPTGSTVTLKLDGTNVRAKDGRTPFSGTGVLLDGALTFQTVAFNATIAVPTAPPTDGGADAGAGGGADAGPAPIGPDMAMSPVTITFTAPVDVTKVATDIKILVGDITTGIQLPIPTVLPDGGVPANAVLAASPTPTTITLTPVVSWPTNTQLTVELSAAATDLLSEPLAAAPTPQSFRTGS